MTLSPPITRRWTYPSAGIAVSKTHRQSMFQLAKVVRASRAMAKRNAMGSLQTLKSRRCCDLPALRFVFLFAILGNTVRKSVKGQLSLIHNPKLSEKE